MRPRTIIALVVISATGAGGFYAGRQEASIVASIASSSLWPGLARLWAIADRAASGQPSKAATGPVIYYRDPDGKPAYSLEPRKTVGGREFVPVHASEDVSFDNEDEAKAVEAGPRPPSAETAPVGRRVRYYRNPMGLPDTSPMPKKDSMGMDYIPVYDGDGEEGAIVKVSLGRLQRTGARSEPVAMRSFATIVRAPGTVQEDERRISVVAMRSDSFVEKVENVTTGDHVHKGQPLMRLYSPDIAAAAAQYLSSIGFQGARQRLENLNVPEPVIAEIERSHKVNPTIVWTAPRDGEIIERNVSDGMRAQPGDVLFKIADHSLVWVLADVAERDLALLAEGQSVSVKVRGYPGREFAGKIALIYPHLMKESRTARVRVELANPDGVLRPDMYADVEIATGSDKPVLAVAESAVLDSGERQAVILDKGEGRFEPREVRLGRHGGGYVEIRKGLKEGDKVVVSANFLIDAESNLKAALQELSAPGDAK